MSDRDSGARVLWASVVVGLVLSGLAGVTPAAATPTTGAAPAVHQDKSVPVVAVASHYRPPAPMPTWKPSTVTWPAGSAQVALSTGHAQAAPSNTGAGSVRAGTLPVWLSPATPAAHATTPAAPTNAPSGVQVTVSPRAAATASGINGVLLSLARTDNPTTSAGVHVTLDYRGYADAFGGDWASRLHLVLLPACALKTPTVPACRTQTLISSTNNTQAGSIAADVTLPATAGGTVVLAATSSASGGGGDYTATSLKPSGSWQAGGSADSFSWSYPIPVPAVPGGLQPQVALSYDSQTVDGLTSATNNQASWIGDGWDYSPGYVERSYQSCHQNPAGPSQTSDNCWSSTNTLTLSLGGRSSTLVKDDATGAYHPQDDSSERVQYLTGAANGSQGGEYFVVTTTDGTQYYFGLNQLPGWASGNPTTNSTWTEPVYAASSFPDEPAGCYNATFAQSHCTLAYRWNLDYVVDTHSDVVSYFYATETNSYAADLGTTASVSYIRGGYLTKIQYGQRAGSVYSTSPAAQVLFNTTGRCNQSTCDPSTLSSSTASNWPDVPFDLNCASGAACTTQGPSFWSEQTLTSIQTQALVGTTETTVDSWALTHTFPTVTDPNTTPSLWLASIQHAGQDTTAGGSSSSITLPAVTFTGTSENNRVNLNNGYPWISRRRLTDIVTETGESITVDYTLSVGSTPACTATTEPTDASTNATLCFPVYWTPANTANPIQDWFNKYIVADVTEHDPTSGNNDDIETTYTPVGATAWHYDDNPTTPTNQRTWNQWRGFGGMIVSTGTSPDPVTQTRYTYFRGMNSDTLPGGGTRTATVTDVHGDPAASDANQFAGDTYETVVYNGAGSNANIVSDTVTDPWSSAATATHALSGLPAQQSFLTGTADTRAYTPLANNTTRATETDYTHDDHGRVTQANDQGDVSTTSDDLCTTTSYADNTTAWILDKPAEVRTVSVACASTPTYPQNAVSDQLSFYDRSTTLGTAPTIGDITQTQKAISSTGSGSTATWTYATSTTTVDQYGRTLTATDPDGIKATTAYTPATGAEPTKSTVTDQLAHVTTTTYDPLRELSTSVADAAGFTTNEQYDALGRLTAVYKPGNPVDSLATPDSKFSYTVSNTGPSVVDSYALNDDNTYRLTETLYDSMLRARETQTQTPDNLRTISDTLYNTDGWVSATTDPYFNSGAVSTTYVTAQTGQAPSSTGYTYDGAGRKTAAIAYAVGNPTWQTTYTYGGNFVTTVPPKGATATTTITDARGRTTDLYQYHTGVPTDPVNDPRADYSDTQYTYTPAGKQASVTDNAGNAWSYTYDLLGNQRTANDPDTGTTTNTYSTGGGQLAAVTDARGKQTTYKYDTVGRKIGAYDTTGGASPASGNQIAAWTYDTVKKGYPAATTSYSGGDTYTQTITGYTSMAEPKGVTTTLTGTDAALVPAGGYTTAYGYTNTGRLDGQDDAAAGGLPEESVGYGFDEFGEPTGVSSAGGISANYVSAVGYDHFGKPLRYTFPANAGNVWLMLQYDQQTQRLTEATTTDSNQSTAVDDITYSANTGGVSPGAGLITATTDQQNGGAVTDTQCFTYDYAQQLSQAWTATDQCAAAPSLGSSATVGGPAPYWQSWSYDAAGDRATQTDHDTSGNTADDTTTTYVYPTAGLATDQPHTLGSTSATGPRSAANTSSYSYDAAGNTTSITGGATGNQTLTWSDQNKVATDTTAGGTSSYVYDADGNLVIRRDPGQTTMFFGDEQIVLNTTTNTLTATRYYSDGGVTIAARSSIAGGGYTDPVYLIPDRQGTDQLAVDSATYAVTRRQYLPFGQSRGTPPTVWPGGDKGYVGGTPDPSTSLENLGAREYDPISGRFLSADPVLELTDPAQMGGYDYAGNDPITSSDPIGLEAGSWCVTQACAETGNDSPGLTGYGVQAGGFGGGGVSTGPRSIPIKKPKPNPVAHAAPKGFQAPYGSTLNTYICARQHSRNCNPGTAAQQQAQSETTDDILERMAEIAGALAGIDVMPQPDYVTVYRVEGPGAGGVPGNERLNIDANGNVSIKGSGMLFLNFGDTQRALSYLMMRRADPRFSGSVLKSFRVPRDYVDRLRESAVPESQAGNNPGRPIIVDTSKAPDQFGLRASNFPDLLANIVPGSGSVWDPSGW